MFEDRLRVACTVEDNCLHQGEHKHHCNDCNVTWKHSEGLIQNLTKEEHATAHSCSNCGRKVTGRFFDGEEPPKYHTPEEMEADLGIDPIEADFLKFLAALARAAESLPS
jgi:predicted RNA-binding Zn-ribbon protein involved in translation (DUF1610 family)